MDFDLLKKFIPPYILCTKEAKVQVEIIENIMIALNVASDVKTKDHRVAKHAMLSMTMFRHGGNVSTTAKVLGVHRNNVFDALQRHHVLYDGGCSGVVWALVIRKIKSYKLGEDVVDVVTQWWASQTTISPNRKDVVRRRITRMVYKSHPTHYLMETQVCCNKSIFHQVMPLLNNFLKCYQCLQ